MTSRGWQDLAKAQAQMVSRRQLRGVGVTRSEIRHHVRIGRWAVRSGEVLSTTTGPLSNEQRLWLGVLHAGPTAMIGGLNAAEHHGLKRWERTAVTILCANQHSFEPLDGFRFVRTRRRFSTLISPGELPVCRIEPAVLMFAADERHHRTALGAVTATVQQRLTSVDSLRTWLTTLSPLRRSRDIRALLDDVGDGAQSMVEVDFRKACREYGIALPRSQRKRKDRSGRWRYTDCEWCIPGGRVLILEIDGAFHDDAAQSASDRARNRKLTSADRIVVQASAYEVRHEPWAVIEDLIALGVPRG
jgi:hypothetical protein